MVARRVELQGHRGARGLSPENSLVGFRKALSVGVDTLELDCGLTRDKVVVVHHDSHLSTDVARDPSGAWISVPAPALRSLSFEELQSYDVGRLRTDSAYAMRFPEQEGADGVRIPRLQEVLREAEARAGDAKAGELQYNIETKLSPEDAEASPSPEELAEAVYQVLVAEGVKDRTTVQSFDWRSLRYLREKDPALRLSCLTSEDPEGDTLQRGKEGPSPWTAGFDVDDHRSTPDLVHAAGCQVWSPRFADVSAEDVARAHELGLYIAVWTVNEPEELDAAIALGVDAIISDRPDRAREALTRAQLPLPPSR